MSERMKFLARLQAGERMTDLCEEFGISRKAGYRLRDRFALLGEAALVDASRAPKRVANRTSAEIRELLLTARRRHSSWGPRKLRAWLLDQHPGLTLPAASTIGDLLRREGLVEPRRVRRCTPAWKGGRSQPTAPNQLWCADYKGEFRLGNTQYCYPLTVTDRFSRMLLACDGFEAIATGSTRQSFEAVFREHGLPQAIRTDNGAPFASRGLHGLSRLSAWWLRLGIRHERIDPAHPQQNGQHERMHLDLKKQTTRPAAGTLLQQQERFDTFVHEYNYERPHEALGQTPPIRHHERSPRLFPERLPDLTYPLHDRTAVLAPSGHIRLGGRGSHYFITSALGGEPVGLREVDDRVWLVTYVDHDLGLIDERRHCFEPADPAGPTQESAAE
ncbi:MAG TPA: IS481 family transposase [Polyangiaceae bacterium]